MRDALDSVLRAGVPGVEVVVSDNSTDPEASELIERSCASAGDGAHYVRPPEPLPMAAHWEWLWRLVADRFAPTHVTYLTDRSVFRAGALAQLVEIAARHPGQVVSYSWDHVKDATTPVELVQAQWTGELLELDTRRLLVLASRGTIGDHLPRLMDCVAPAAVVEAVARRFGDVFGPIAPDYRFAYRCLAVCDTILFLDRACLIERGMAQSAGGSFLRGSPNEHAERFARELTEPRFAATPEPRFETNANAILQEYCAVRAEAGGERLPPLDPWWYLAANAVSASRIRDPAWRSRTEELLRANGWTRLDRIRYAGSLGVRMAGYLLRHPAELARTVKRQVYDRPPGTPAAQVLTRLGFDPRLRDELRFETAAEAIAYADAHPRPRQPHSWPVHQLERAGAVVRRYG